MHIKIYISPLREYDLEPTVLLAEMQSKYCIPASGHFVVISVPVPTRGRAPNAVHLRERKCEADAASPLRGSESGCVQYRLRYCT